MRVKRSQAYNLRNTIHEVERKIPSNDRGQLAEWERDLIATACVALWDVDMKHLLSCLRRLTSSPERKEAWEQVLKMAKEMVQPVYSQT